MENQKPNNPHAFPRIAFDQKGDITTWDGEFQGMTLRDYFANSAMQVILKHKIEKGGLLSSGFAEHCVTEMAYDTADAMLKQRELNTN
jgi:hypothetical protein